LKDDAKELMNMGATPKTAVLLAAASELIKRRTEEDVRTAETLSGAEEAYRFLKPRLADLPHEVFGVIFLNQDQAEQERRNRNATDQDQARVGDFLHGRPGAHH
jgi:DNA repair protein RadC